MSAGVKTWNLTCDLHATQVTKQAPHTQTITIRKLPFSFLAFFAVVPEKVAEILGFGFPAALSSGPTWKISCKVFRVELWS